MGALSELGRDGYVVLPKLASAHQLAGIRRDLAPFLTGRLFGRTDFEGFRSERVYALLAKAPSVAALVEHPTVLELVDAVLDPDYLLSANLAINVDLVAEGTFRRRAHVVNQVRSRGNGGGQHQRG